MSKPNLSGEIASLLFSCARALRQQFDLKNPVFHLPVAHLETLRFVAHKGQTTMREIAGFLAITPPSATALVDHLVKLKILQRRQDRQDRRTILVSLTPKGKTIMAQALAAKEKQIHALLKNLSQTEQKSLRALLRKLVTATPRHQIL